MNKVVNRPGSSKPDNQNQIKSSNNNNQNKKPNNVISNPVKSIIPNKQYKHEAPLIPKSIPHQKMILNRPISSKVDQKILSANHQLKKMPEAKVIGNKIKISEKIVKNNHAIKKNYGNNNLNNNKQQPIKVGYNMGPKIVNIKK